MALIAIATLALAATACTGAQGATRHRPVPAGTIPVTPQIHVPDLASGEAPAFAWAFDTSPTPTSTPVATPAPPPEPAPEQRTEGVAASEGETRYLPPPGDAVERWRPLVAAYFPASAVDEALSVMECESGGQNIQNASGGPYFGPMQVWSGNFRPGEDWWDPETNIRVAARLWKESGWALWDCRP